MKISIGTQTKDGPWGGGNLFAINLSKYLISKGYEVVNNLKDKDIDIILITEPRKTSESSAFTHIDVENYLNFINPQALVAHRINECDERKNTNFVNKYLIEANKIADHTIFVSRWLKNLYLTQGINRKNNNVILAGADAEIFNNNGLSSWNSNQKLKIVTHHWGASWNKGFEIYEFIDELLMNDYWKEKIDFTYIGNLPKKFNFKNSNYYEPMSGLKLASKLKEHNIYLTGSINEPSGNHHIEGAQCGLPIMYIDSGGVAEYCKQYGIEYKKNDLEEKFNYIFKNYDYYFERMKNYPFNSLKMCQDFENLFNVMIKNKQELLEIRTLRDRNAISKKYYLIKNRFLN